MFSKVYSANIGSVSKQIAGQTARMRPITLKCKEYNYNHFQKLQLKLQLLKTSFKSLITITNTLGK